MDINWIEYDEFAELLENGFNVCCAQENELLNSYWNF